MSEKTNKCLKCGETLDLAAVNEWLGGLESSSHPQQHEMNGSDHLITEMLDWDKINKVGSNLTEIETRNHNSLTGIGVDDHHIKFENLVEDVSPQLGGALNLNGKNITQILIAGENLINGNLCYLKSDGKFWKTDANAAASATTMLAIAIETINVNNSGTFIILGNYETSGLTVGDNYWISASMIGTWVNTAGKPSGSGDIIRLIGYAISATILYFDTDKSWIELV